MERNRSPRAPSQPIFIRRRAWAVERRAKRGGGKLLWHRFLPAIAAAASDGLDGGDGGGRGTHELPLSLPPSERGRWTKKGHRSRSLSLCRSLPHSDGYTQSEGRREGRKPNECLLVLARSLSLLLPLSRCVVFSASLCFLLFCGSMTRWLRFRIPSSCLLQRATDAARKRTTT